MVFTLQHNSYGKSNVRVTKVVRTGDRHELHEYCSAIELQGDFASSYSKGDNSAIVATDSMKNTVYVLAAERDFDSPESFARILAEHFVSTYPQVKVATVEIAATLWHRIAIDGESHNHAFTGGLHEKRMARVSSHSGTIDVNGGIAGLTVLKTTNSAFAGFLRDRYTTLPEVQDRIFATSIDCWWKYNNANVDFNNTYESARRAVLSTFACHMSLAVQQTLQAMAEAILSACPPIEEVELSLPNQHRIPVDLKPFNLQNDNRIFIPTTEPFGLIKGKIVRSADKAERAAVDT